MSVRAILADLVGFPSLPATPNGAILGYIRALLARHGVEAAVLPGPEGDRANAAQIDSIGAPARKHF